MLYTRQSVYDGLYLQSMEIMDDLGMSAPYDLLRMHHNAP